MDTAPSGSTPRSGSEKSSTSRRAKSSSWKASGATVIRTSVGESSIPTARIRPFRLQVRTAAAVSAVPNR